MRQNSFSVALGYAISPRREDRFGNLFIGPLFSHKKSIRFGIGLGLTEAPDRLKDGILVGQPLPNNISDINDIIEYRDKLGFYLTLTITGLSL